MGVGSGFSLSTMKKQTVAFRNFVIDSRNHLLKAVNTFRATSLVDFHLLFLS